MRSPTAEESRPRDGPTRPFLRIAPNTLMPSGGVTNFRLTQKGVWLARVVVRRNGKRVRSMLGIDGLLDGSAPTLTAALADLADSAFLRAKRRPRPPTRKR